MGILEIFAIACAATLFTLATIFGVLILSTRVPPTLLDDL